VVVGDLPHKMVAGKAKKPAKRDEVGRLGMVVDNLNDQLRDRTGVNDGVVVVAVQRGDAAQAGLRRGDVVTMINGQRIDSVADFEQAVESLETGDMVPVRIVRQGRPIFVPLKVTG